MQLGVVKLTASSSDVEAGCGHGAGEDAGLVLVGGHGALAVDPEGLAVVFFAGDVVVVDRYERLPEGACWREVGHYFGDEGGHGEAVGVGVAPGEGDVRGVGAAVVGVGVERYEAGAGGGCTSGVERR